MVQSLLKILPIVAVFFAGVALRRLGWLRPRHADVLLRIVVYVGLPALILSSLTRIELRADLALLPLCAVLTVLATWPVVLGVGRALRLSRPSLGAFVTGAMIMNMAFEYPFVLVAWGEEGFARLALFDLGSGLLVLTLVYAQACWFGSGRSDPRATLKEVAAFPPLWALLLALGINLGDVTIAPVLIDVLRTVGGTLVLLVMLALGLHFDLRLLGTRVLAWGLALRPGLGLALGWLWVELFALHGLTRAVVLLAVAAPVGFNTLVFAAREGLDRELAASLASVSMLLALLYLPVLLIFLS